MSSKRERKKVNLSFLILFLFCISCQDNKPTLESYTKLDSIEIYKKYRSSDYKTDLPQSRIVYYFKTSDTLNYMNTGRLISFYDSNLYRHEYLIDDGSGFTLNTILSLNDDILNFKSAFLLDKNKETIDTLLNTDAKIILYLDGVRINKADSISMNKSIPLKPLEKPKL